LGSQTEFGNQWMGRLSPIDWYHLMTICLSPLLICSLLALPVPPQNANPQLICACTGLSLEKLATMPWCELESLYRQTSPGNPPAGELRGLAIYDRDRRFSKLRSAGTRAVWLGKDFDPEQGMLVNRWRVGRAIKAEVYPGTSWLDGRPALVMDYRHTSFVWRTVRDELREVAPGLYLGAMYKCESSGPRFVMYFALQDDRARQFGTQECQQTTPAGLSGR
jgi:hypothetical protein